MLSLLQEHWTEIKERVRDEYEITRISYETWLLPMNISSFDEKNHILVISHPENLNPNIINYLKSRFTLPFQVIIEEVTGLRVSVNFSSEDKVSDSIFTNNNSATFNAIKKNILDPKYTFDNFVVGASNRFAHAASISVSERPAEEYNPLFIYGGPGLGKTHLMHAIGNAILQNNPGLSVRYIPAERLVEAVVEGTFKGREKMMELKEELKNSDVLLVDDIQNIIGTESTQNEFFNTFNYLYINKKQIVISSDRPPKEMENLNDRLTSRFEMGLIVDINTPDYETRMAILRKKEDIEGISIDNEILQYIATNLKSNIRQLEGALNKVCAFKKLNPKETLNLNTVKEILKDTINPEDNKLTPNHIIKVVAEHFGVKAEDIKSDKRSKDVSLARHVSMYLIRLLTDISLEEIGKAVGNKDHSTIIYGNDKIQKMVQKDKDMEKTIEILKKKLINN